MNDIKPTNKSQPTAAPHRAPANKRPKKLLPKVLFSLILVALIATSAFFGVKYYELKNNPSAVVEKETENLEAKIGKLMSLPKDEKPTIATVEDKEKLKDQPFFADAENGDKIVIYTNAKKAIIYRESANKIINVGPIALSGDNSKELEDK